MQAFPRFNGTSYTGSRSSDHESIIGNLIITLEAYISFSATSEGSLISNCESIRGYLASIQEVFRFFCSRSSAGGLLSDRESTRGTLASILEVFRFFLFFKASQ